MFLVEYCYSGDCGYDGWVTYCGGDVRLDLVMW